MENKCENCNKELKENIESFCTRCEKKLSYNEKELLLSQRLDESISKLGE